MGPFSHAHDGYQNIHGLRLVTSRAMLKCFVELEFIMARIIH